MTTRKSWTTTGRGASLGSQRREFAKALQERCGGRNNGLSTVYAYLRDKDSPSGKAGSPYYIGIAVRSRRPYCPRHTAPVPSDERRIRILRSGVTPEQAKAWEKHYIAVFGRKDIGTGRKMLLNRTDGGDGVNGLKVSQLTRERMSVAQAGRVHSPEALEKMAATKIESTAIKYGVDPAFYASLTKRERFNVRQRFNRGVRGAALFEQEATLSQAGSKGSAIANGAKMLAAASEMGLDPSVYITFSSQQRKTITQRYRRGRRGADLLAGLIDPQLLAA